MLTHGSRQPKPWLIFNVTQENMRPVSTETLAKAVEILGEDSISSEELESRIGALVGDAATGRRLIDWIPEAFGVVLVSHLGRVTLPTEFHAKDANGEWVTFPLSVEPVFEGAVKIAQGVFHSGPRSIFQNVSSRSAILNAANRCLEAGRKLDGAKLEGPALIGIPAETYRAKKKSI